MRGIAREVREYAENVGMLATGLDACAIVYLSSRYNAETRHRGVGISSPGPLVTQIGSASLRPRSLPLPLLTYLFYLFKYANFNQQSISLSIPRVPSF